jgi:hypothetical protein
MNTTPGSAESCEPSLVSWAQTAQPVRLPAMPTETLNDLFYGLVAIGLAVLAVFVGILA